MADDKSLAQRILDQAARESGWHSSRSDNNDHLSIKNSNGKVTGHAYEDGMIKGTNQDGSGSLGWFQK